MRPGSHKAAAIGREGAGGGAGGVRTIKRGHGDRVVLPGWLRNGAGDAVDRCTGVGDGGGAVIG